MFCLVLFRFKSLLFSLFTQRIEGLAHLLAVVEVNLLGADNLVILVTLAGTESV